jgi:hypothetical protein
MDVCCCGLSLVDRGRLGISTPSLARRIVNGWSRPARPGTRRPHHVELGLDGNGLSRLKFDGNWFSTSPRRVRGSEDVECRRETMDRRALGVFNGGSCGAEVDLSFASSSNQTRL